MFVANGRNYVQFWDFRLVLSVFLCFSTKPPVREKKIELETWFQTNFWDWNIFFVWFLHYLRVFKNLIFCGLQPEWWHYDENELKNPTKKTVFFSGTPLKMNISIKCHYIVRICYSSSFSSFFVIIVIVVVGKLQPRL